MKNYSKFLDNLNYSQISRRRFLQTAGSLLTILAMPVSVKNVFADAAVTVAVFGTADLHGNILNWDYLSNAAPAARDGATVGLARISSLVKQERSKYPYNVLVDNGDIIQGTPLDAYFATVNKNWTEHPMIQVFNHMKYDAINLGNHEFNFGMDFLRKVVASAEAPCLSANTRSVPTNKPWPCIQPYTIKKIDVSGTTGVAGDVIKIGIIGTVTPSIPNFEAPQNYNGVHFTAQEDAINANISLLKQQNIDAIVVLSHSGIPSASTPYPENGIVAIAHKCPGVNLIMSGHTHVRTAENMTDFAASNIDRSVTPSVTYGDGVINGVRTMAPYRWGAYLAEGLLSFAKVNGKWQVQNVSTALLSANSVEDDAHIVALAQPWDEATRAYLNTRVGISTAAYYGANGDKMYTPLVDLVNRVQMHYGQADVSAAASFNASALIPQGNVTLQHVSSIYIYENYMFTIQITGKQLKQYLELTACYFDQVAAGVSVDGLISSNLSNVSTKNANWPSYNYDMLTGVNYQINISKPIGSRIQNITYPKSGAAVRDNDSIKLAINNYRYNGGGPLAPASVFPQSKGLSGFMAVMGLDSLGRNGLAKPTVLWDSQKALGDGGQVRSLMANYIQAKGTISPNTNANWTLTSN